MKMMVILLRKGCGAGSEPETRYSPATCIGFEVKDN